MKLKKGEDYIWENMIGESDGYQTRYNFSEILDAIKEAQKNAIEVALQYASDNVDSYEGCYDGGSMCNNNVEDQIIGCKEELFRMIDDCEENN